MNCSCRGVTVPTGAVFIVFRIWLKLVAETFPGLFVLRVIEDVEPLGCLTQNCSFSRNWN
jgi:hypothetical protein